MGNQRTITESLHKEGVQMKRKQAFIIADHMVQVNKKLFNPNMTWADYVKHRESIIKELIEE